MRKVLEIDNDGYFMEDVIISDEEETPKDCIETECRDVFIKPKWDGEKEKWIEGATKEDMEYLNKPSPQVTTEERLKALELALLEIL